MRITDAPRDRSDANVTVIDVPAFLAGIGRAAAGESGHAALKRDFAGEITPEFYGTAATISSRRR